MGALESNAGDEFHFWWAASRALALIKPGTDSRLLVVEGLSRVDDPDDQYETVDVAEYFGGDDFDSATALVLFQLKYSTRHPDQPWTTARLCRPRIRRRADGSAGAARSVIADLAAAFARLVAHHGRDAVVAKVRIRLVSNQPGDPLLQASITAAAEWARAQGAASQCAAMLRALTCEHAAMIRALADAVGTRLRSGEFCDFLTVLDVPQTGVLDRAALARSVRANASELAPGRGPDSALRMFDLVRREALPESRRDGLRAADVLAELGVAELLDLYPAPPRLPGVLDPLPASGARAVAEAALAHLGGVVVAHGQLGAGKTTTMLQVADHLPAGSVVVLFDCYGGGEYLSSGEERHTPQRFVTQTVNDLAQRCGTPLLVQPPQIEDDLWRLLARTLSRAVDTLDPGAVLVLVADAADNAAVAATERGDRGFLPGLVGLRLPPRVAVVLTARSHRVESLGAVPASRVEVVPFDRETSAAHLRRHRPAASDVDAAEFHTRTGGNPRAQFYALEQADKADWDMPTLLEACARTPQTLFDDIVNSALQVSGADAGGQRWLALMVALARPVSTATLAAALGVDLAAVDAFAAGLVPGVNVVDGAIQFRDEDFETYVRDRVDPADVIAAHDRLADMFLAARAADADAAAHVADHLFHADRLDELLRLVLDEDSPQGIADGFRREQVQGQRLDLAARAAAATGSAAAAVRIAARGCDTASRLDTLSRLVESRLDLVARYADVDLLRAYALRQRRGEWFAPVEMRLAAALARDPERHAAARAALDSAQAWLRRWMAGRENETQHWQLDADDVASAAEARYRLDGVDAAVTELRRWRPAQFALDAAAALAVRVAGEIGPDAVRDMLRAHHLPTAAQAPFLAYAASPEADPDPGWVNEVLTALLAVDVGEPRPWQAHVLDTAVRHGDRQAAAALAQHWARELPGHRWAFSSGDSNGTAALRCHATAAALADRDLDVGALVPASLRPKERVNGHADDPRAHDRGEWTATVRPLAAVAVLAARAAAGDAVGHAVVALVDAGLADRTARAGHRWFTYDTSYHAWAQLAVGAVVDAAAPVDLLDRLANAAPALLRDGAPALWLDLAEALASRSAHTGRAADLCLRAAAHVRSNAYPAPDRLELLARAAEIAGSVAPAVGRRLFDQAVDAATGINDDAARLLAVHADLASRARIAPLDRAGVAARLVRAAEDVALHVSESGVVPYAAVAGGVARLDAVVGLAAASRWDDEDRVRLVSTLPAALVGAVDGGGVAAQEALDLDHLIEDDGARLDYQLAVIDRLAGGAAGTAAVRIALSRAAEWLRCHVPARSQPTLARRLVDAAAVRGLDGHLRAKLDPVCALRPGKGDGTENQPLIRWRATETPPAAQALLDDPARRGWTTLDNDVTVLADAHVYGDMMRSFVAAVACAAPPDERLDALAAVAALPDRHGTDIVLPVLATCVKQWCDWPGVGDWAASALPGLLAQYLPDLAWRQDSGPLLSELRAFADDHAIRRAVLMALPEARPRLTAHGWQNIAAPLGQLCDAADAADALGGLLADRANDDVDRDRVTAVRAPDPDPIPQLLWSAFGHPRREVRWRAAHAARELLTRSDPAETAPLAATLVGCLDRNDAGEFRDPSLHFYHLSAAAALLVALHRVAIDRPAVLAPHLPALTRHATSHTLPHAQIRQLARDAALAVAAPGDPAIALLHRANQPTKCRIDRKRRHGDSDRNVSDQRRYDFDLMDTIPYWYAPLARVFDVPVDTIAEHAEPWILDRWGHSQDDWWTDTRELRDQRSWERTSHRHGSIPSEEKLQLYLEYHAMMTAAGELVDAGQPLHIDGFDDGDPWQDWLAPHLPSPGRWLVDLRAPVPAEADLVGDLPPLNEWDTPGPIDHDRALGLLDGHLPDPVLVAGYTSLSRHGARSTTYIHSAVVAPDHAADLQRALAAATNPTDWKLPDEDEDEFEVNYGRFDLRGWLTDPRDYRDRIDEHDPYARGLRTALPLPGHRFRIVTGAAPDPSGLVLLAHDGAVLARAEQWADPDAHTDTAVASSGDRVYVDRAALLRYLAETGSSLIVEVQIGRHRSNTDPGNYRLPRSRVYLVDAAGRVTTR